jgi:hypothetical protein
MEVVRPPLMTKKSKRKKKIYIYIYMRVLAFGGDRTPRATGVVRLPTDRPRGWLFC